MNQKINLTTRFVNIVTKIGNINSELLEYCESSYFFVSKKKYGFCGYFRKVALLFALIT